MGDPKKPRKKYKSPLKPWVKSRIIEENKLRKEFGLKTKREIWKAVTLLKSFRERAKEVTKLKSAKDPNAEVLEKELLKTLVKYGILSEDAELDDVLNLTVRDILNRRLQTLVYKKGLAKTIKQARQLIVHKHIMVGDKVVNVPSYLVKKEEEELIKFHPNSENLKLLTQKVVKLEEGNNETAQA